MIKIKISWDKTNVKKDKIIEAPVYYYDGGIIGSSLLHIEISDEIIISHRPSTGCKYLPPVLEIFEVKNTVESLAEAFIEGCQFTDPLVQNIDIFHYFTHDLKGVETEDKPEESKGCPHCGEENFIPDVVHTNMEMYGGKVLNFQCKKCGKYVKISGQRTVVFGKPTKSTESDFWNG